MDVDQHLGRRDGLGRGDNQVTCEAVRGVVRGVVRRIFYWSTGLLVYSLWLYLLTFSVPKSVMALALASRLMASSCDLGITSATTRASLSTHLVRVRA